ncbi:MAG: proline dehydrogenase family protein [Acidobacteria bacterium]|nr:proline dehydrogenase family protein [Acidobacteriota bacterium]
MGLFRSALLAGSRSVWLRERAVKLGFVRRAVSRFMPGETLDDALGAARALASRKLSVVLTCLGENVTSLAETDGVARHYLEAMEAARAAGLDVELSVKLTQLGLDLDAGLALTHVDRIAARAAELRQRLWIDMEDSRYTERTLDLYRKLRKARPNAGLCLQSYLRRTAADLESLIPLGSAIRLVKGAYNEPPDIAFPVKRDVDESYFALSKRLLSEEARRAGCYAAFGTHDRDLIRRIEEEAARVKAPREAFEFELLYGIQTGEQARLAGSGTRVRVLISYGSFWFPWYMRRLAERPANVLFVARQMFGR